MVNLNSDLNKEILAHFKEGNVLHKNAVFLLCLGLPLIKLDGFYRGVFSKEDVHQLCAQMSEEEGKELATLLFSRPFGKESLVGWQRFLFSRGFL